MNQGREKLRHGYVINSDYKGPRHTESPEALRRKRALDKAEEMMEKKKLEEDLDDPLRD